MKKMNLLKTTTLAVVLVFSGLLASCSEYNQTNTAVDTTAARIKQVSLKSRKPAPAVKISDSYYVDTTPVSLKKQPAWMTKRVNLEARGLPLNVLMQQLLRNTDLNVAFDNTINANQLVNLNYRGSLAGALKTIARKTNYAYKIESGVIDWSAFENKTFNISFMPGSSTYMVGQMNGEQQAGGGMGVTNSVSQLNDQQYSNLTASLSVWHDLEATLNRLKSKMGNVVISESTTTVTVHDRPQNIAAMAQYIRSMNHMLSQEVAIKVQVLQLDLNSAFNAGINWGLVANAIGTQFGLKGNLANATNLVNNDIGSANGGSSTLQFSIGPKDQQSVIQALQQQGKLSTVTKPQVVTMNNQIASIRITTDTGYVQSISTTTIQGSGAQTSITPGNITDGFTLYLLPKIQGNQVYMQISSTISSLLALQKVSNAPTASDDTDSSTKKSDNQSFQAIQVPTLAEKQFNQRSVIGNGSTLVIAGYKSMVNQVSNTGPFGLTIMGGKGSKRKNVETLVLITPTILKTSSSNVDYNT